MKTHASLDDSGRSVLVLKSLRRYIREKKIQTLEKERNLESVSHKEDVLADLKANITEIFQDTESPCWWEMIHSPTLQCSRICA